MIHVPDAVGPKRSVSTALGLSASGIILDEDMTIHHTRQLWNQKYVSLIHVISSSRASRTSLWGDLNTIGSTAGRLLTAQSLSEVTFIYGQYSAHVVPVRETSFPNARFGFSLDQSESSYRPICRSSGFDVPPCDSS